MPVSRRRVFYIPGYDPLPPRRYREIYRTEAARQAAISGFEIALAGRQGADRYGWRVEAQMEGRRVTSEFEVLVWSDIVQESMDASIPGTYGQLVRTAWTYVASGALRRLMWLQKGPIVAALYPVAVLLVQLLLAVLAARLAGAAAALLHPLLFWPVALPVAVLVLRGFRAIDNRIYAYYLMHDYAFSAALGGENPPALEARMAAFADAIAEALRGEADEVLVVGHSSGAHLAVSVLADLLRDGRVPENGPALGFLSLGQVIPMMSFLPRAWRLRADLRYLSESARLAWVDITAQGDGCAFALCDPVAVSGVATERSRWPLVLSAAYSQTMAEGEWKANRRRYFKLHFQYLCAFARPGDYDYFRVTAGPLTLADRFMDRRPSPSRIDVPASPHTSTTAAA